MRADLAMRVGWICQALVSGAILAFGIVVVLLPMEGDGLLLRADGLALIGVGLFGGLIAIIPFRRRETVGLVGTVVLPGVLDRPPRRRSTPRQGSSPPGRVHRALTGRTAVARSAVLPRLGASP